MNTSNETTLDAVEKIFLKKAQILHFQSQTRQVYKVSMGKRQELLYEGVKGKFEKFVKGIREDIMNQPDSVFLDALLRRWKDHQMSLSKTAKDLLMFLERNYVQQKKKKPIYELGVQLFGDQVFHKNCLDRILRLILSIIQQERNGEIVSNKFMLRDLCRMMIEISKKDVYEKHFEEAFLRESREFLKAEARYFFNNNTSTAFLDKVLQRLRTEREISKRCFHEDTLVKIENVLKEEMIVNFKELIITKEGSGCEVMLRDWKLDDLKKCFNVLGLVKNALIPLQDLVYKFCKFEGEAITKDKDKQKKFFVTVEDLIELWQKYDHLLGISFSKKTPDGYSIRDSDFSRSISRGFDDVLNEDKRRISEFISLYIDSKLRTGKEMIEESEFDSMFERVIQVFRHVREKDIFEEYYKRHLSTRLLRSKSQSVEAERSFIGKLKVEFGKELTQKVERMLQDMNLNNSLGDEFRRHSHENKLREDLIWVF